MPKVELIRTPATKRHRDGEEEDEMAEPVEDMDVDEMEACQCLPGQQDFSTSVQRKCAKTMSSTPKRRSRPRMTMSGGPTINDAEYHKSQILTRRRKCSRT